MCRTIGLVDAYSVLGLSPGASADEVAAAYRRLAKEWHPDVHGTEAGVRRMVAINAAYEELRSGGALADAAAPAGAGPSAAKEGAVLGRELSAVLRPGESVVMFAAASMWDSPEAFLVLTSLRLLWLLDDAVTHRVRSLALSQVASVSVEVGRVRRRRATLRVVGRRGRRYAFTELEVATARAFAAGLRAATS